MSIIPIGVSRVSSSLQTNTALYALQKQNSSIAKINQQILTQQRYQYGSDAPYDAAISVSTQMQIERKTQNASNLIATQYYLAASESTLSKVTALLDESKGYALSAISTTTSATERSSLAQSVQNSLQTIFNFGNTKFLDRYLFSGATTSTQAFTWTDSYTVVYNGTNADLYNWSDTHLLSQSNISGATVFGALSEPVKGSVDLNPSITGSTLLGSLNGGNGIEGSTISLTYTDSNGTTQSTIDISRCATVDDLRNTIAKNAPKGATVKVGLSSDGLTIDLVSSDPKASLTITETNSGWTAHQLGIYTKTPIRPGTTFTGSDLAPVLTRSTSLDTILGTSAGTTLRFPGNDNDLVIQSKEHGDAYNDMNIAFQSSASIAPGAEYAEYDSETNTLLVHISPDYSTAANVAAAINRASEEGVIPPIAASVDAGDTSQIGGTAGLGNGFVSILPGDAVVLGTLQGGAGTSFDLESGIQLVNGGVTYTIDLSGAKTMDDILSILNNPEYGLLAEFNADKTGINVYSRISGADFMIGENGGTTASQLGIRTLDEGTYLNELDFNRGVMDYEGPGTNANASYQADLVNAGLFIIANEEGPEWNDYNVIFTPTTDPDGNVTIAWDEDAKEIYIGIVPGVTKACEVVIAFNEQPGPNAAFTMELDGSLGINTGQGVVYDGQMITDYGSDGGVDFTITRNDGTILEININGAKTVGDVLDIINSHPKNQDGLLVASLSKYGNGIELTDYTIGSHTTQVTRAELSTAAIDLGLIPYGEECALSNSGGAKASVHVTSEAENSDLLFIAHQGGSYANGVKVEFVDKDVDGGSGVTGFTWDASSQTLRFEIEPGVTTAADIVTFYQENASETLRQMFDIQNGTNPDGTTSSGAGLVSLFQEADAPVMDGGTNNVLTGTDPNPLETESVFTALIRLQKAMENNDTREIERATNLLEKTIKTVDAGRAEIGIRANSLDAVESRLADENILLQQVLANSLEISLDTVAIDYSAAQLAYEAMLQITSQMYRLSLFNYM